jgi:hypothetical protein
MLLTLPVNDGPVRIEIRLVNEDEPVISNALANEIREIEIAVPAGTVERIWCYPTTQGQRSGDGWILRDSVWQHPDQMGQSAGYVLE